MMRLLFVIESPSFGGAEKVLQDIVNNIDPIKFQVSVCSLFNTTVFGKTYPSEIKFAFRRSIKYRYLFNSKLPGVSIFANWALYRFPSFLYRFLIGDRYDYVVAFYEGAPTRFVSKAPIKQGKKIAWLHTSTKLSQKGKSNSLLYEEELLYHSFSKIIAVSQDVSNSFSFLFPKLADKLFVVYNPVDSLAVRTKAAEETIWEKPPIPLLVSVGRINWAKGFDRYLCVLKNLAEKGYAFQAWIIGGGERGALESYRNHASLENVTFLGHLDNPFPLLKMADWIIVPSYVEGLSMVILEGLALGKAVLATDSGGPREILGDCEYGLLVQNNEQALEAGIEVALTDNGLKVSFERKTASRCKDFELDTCLPRIESIFRE